MSEIQVQYSSLNTAAQDIRSAAGKIKTQLEDLEREVRRVAATWEGEAKEAYQARQAVWDREAGQLNTHLHEIANKVAMASDGYHATDRRQARNYQ